MKKVRIIALILSAVLWLTGCSYGDFESYELPVGIVGVSDERVGESELLGVRDRPSNMVDMTSQQLVESIRVGINIGNTLDACVTDRDGDGIAEKPAEGAEIDETLWGNPYISRELFKSLTDDGINAVRLPITWRDHIDEEGNIAGTWLNRVQQVVDYAYSCGLYVIINVHNDGASDSEYGAWLLGAATDYDAVISRYNRIWAQVAERFKNYNERLIFESMNEVGFDSLSDDMAYHLLNRINQEFVDLIRESGGNNDKRHLLIAGYKTDIAKTCDERFIMPDDRAKHCIVSVHYYTPWEYCRADIQDDWGSRAEEREMENLILALKETFTDRNIPVIIGEYAARGTQETSRIYFCEKLTKLCHDSKIACFLWDDGTEVNRESGEWRTPELIKALNRAVSGEEYTPERLNEIEEISAE